MSIVIETGVPMNGTEATKQSLIKSFKEAGYAPMSGNLSAGTYDLQVTSEAEYFGLRPWAKDDRKGAIICLACSGTDQDGKAYTFGLPTEKTRTFAIMEDHLMKVKQGSKVQVVINDKGYIASFTVLDQSAGASTPSTDGYSLESLQAMSKPQLQQVATDEGITFDKALTKPQLVELLTGELV